MTTQTSLILLRRVRSALLGAATVGAILASSNGPAQSQNLAVTDFAAARSVNNQLTVSFRLTPAGTTVLSDLTISRVLLGTALPLTSTRLPLSQSAVTSFSAGNLNATFDLSRSASAPGLLRIFGAYSLGGAAQPFETSYPVAGPTVLTTPDSDGDGVPDRLDPCPETPLGGVVLAHGCSALDITESPGVFLDPVLNQLTEVSSRAREVSSLAGVLSALDQTRTSLADTGARIRAGSVCEGAQSADAAIRQIGLAQTELRQVIAAMEAALRQRAPVRVADSTSADLQLLSALVMASKIDNAIILAQDAQRVLEQTCGEVAGTTVANGIVSRIDNRCRRVEIEGRLVAGIAPTADVVSGLFAGGRVQINGVQFRDRTGLGTTLFLSAGNLPAKTPASSRCLGLLFAPEQRSDIFFAGPFLLHKPTAYQYWSEFHVEPEAGFAVEDTGCPVILSPQVDRQSLELKLTYQKSSNAAILTTTTLASDLRPNDAPVLLPSDIYPGSLATLTVNFWSYGGLMGINGTSWKTATKIDILVYNLKVYPRHSLCTAMYGVREFDLEDRDQTEFRRGRVSGILTAAEPDLIPDPGTTTKFSALGHAALSATVSTYPNESTIGVGQDFAVYNFDFFGATPLFNEQITGVETPSGLEWPRITGTRQGQQFIYSCSVPPITRDLVSSCGSPPNSYYRLPFSGGSHLWEISQGNNSSFTHNGSGAWAFDFTAPEGTPILAARGGTVIFVRQDQSGNSYYNPDCTQCAPNELIIRHQDGTEGRYLHMQQFGVLQKPGNTVHRGDVVGLVGNTGYSTDPHVHFQVQWPNAPSIPSSFQEFWAPTTLIRNCYVPQVGDFLSSNNQ